MTADLKALCLSSKACRALATPRLYLQIVVPLWSKKDVFKLIQCFTQGAAKFLRYTKSLTLQDLQENYIVGDEIPARERDLLAPLILSLFSEHKISTFRLVTIYQSA